MAPVEAELKDGWAIGLKPEERKITVQAGKRQELLPTHPNNFMIVECNPDDNGGLLKYGKTHCKLKLSKQTKQPPTSNILQWKLS